MDFCKIIENWLKGSIVKWPDNWSATDWPAVRPTGPMPRTTGPPVESYWPAVETYSPAVIRRPPGTSPPPLPKVNLSAGKQPVGASGFAGVQVRPSTAPLP